MTWRVARSLDQLLVQLNALAPNRSRVSDGSIGDVAHQAEGSASDHNPWLVLNGQELVTARDFTHDPANGLDCGKLAAALIASRDPRIKYIIWQGRICDSRPQFSPWTWQPSSGHDKHLHLSVMDNASADDARPWSLPGLSDEEDDVTLSVQQDGWVRDTKARVDELHAVVISGAKRDAKLNLDLGFVMSTIGGQITGLQAAVSVLAAKVGEADGVSAEEIEEAVAKAIRDTADETARAQAAMLAPLVEAALERVQDTDNVDEAKQTVAELLRQLTALAPTA